MIYGVFFFFKQKTAYEMRISDWSSDVCSSDLCSSSDESENWWPVIGSVAGTTIQFLSMRERYHHIDIGDERLAHLVGDGDARIAIAADPDIVGTHRTDVARSEEHTSELQSLMRISYAVFCLKKKKQTSIIATIAEH